MLPLARDPESTRADPESSRADPESSRAASLVVVSGLPASGKTTLARALGDRLSLPVVERDRLAEVCFDALGPEHAVPLGSVSYELLLHVARVFLRTGGSLLMESNFSRTRHESQLRALAAATGHRIVEVHCRAPGDVLLNRFTARAVAGDRHARHDDLPRLDEFRTVFADPARHRDALIFPDEALIVDTSTEVSLNGVLDALAALARRPVRS